MFHLKGALGRPVGRFCEAGRSFITLLGVVSGGVWFYDGDVVFGICDSVGRRVGCCWARIICMVVYGGAWLQAACGNPVVTWCRCAARAGRWSSDSSHTRSCDNSDGGV